MKRDSNEIGLLSSSLNSFKKLVGMLAGPNAFLAFSELIIDVTSSSFVALNPAVMETMFSWLIMVTHGYFMVMFLYSILMVKNVTIVQ